MPLTTKNFSPNNRSSWNWNANSINEVWPCITTCTVTVHHLVGGHLCKGEKKTAKKKKYYYTSLELVLGWNGLSTRGHYLTPSTFSPYEEEGSWYTHLHPFVPFNETHSKRTQNGRAIWALKNRTIWFLYLFWGVNLVARGPLYVVWFWIIVFWVVLFEL